MKTLENQPLKAPGDKEPARAGFLQKLTQLAEAWEFDPQEALFLEVKALRNEVREVRQAIGLKEK